MSKLKYTEGKGFYWKNNLITDEYLMEEFGMVEIIYSNTDDILGFYTDLELFIIAKNERDAILKIINILATEKISHYYEDALDEAHGFSKEYKTLIINNVSTLSNMIRVFKLVDKMPKTYKAFQEYEDALDLYYSKP